MKERGFLIRDGGSLKDEDFQEASVLALGLENPVLRKVFDSLEPLYDALGLETAPDEKFPTLPGGFGLTTLKNPLRPEKVIAVAYASSREKVDAAASKIFHYGPYSRLWFKMGKNVEKSMAPSDRGIRYSLAESLSK